MPTIKLFIPQLADGGDIELERVLRTVSGVYGVVASHGGGCCEIDFEDDVVGVDELIEVVRRAGYEARLAG